MYYVRGEEVEEELMSDKSLGPTGLYLGHIKPEQNKFGDGPWRTSSVKRKIRGRGGGGFSLMYLLSSKSLVI